MTTSRPVKDGEQDSGAVSPSPTGSEGGHLTALAIELGAVEFGGYCPLHGEELLIHGTLTGRWAHQTRTEDMRRALCVAGQEIIEVRNNRND